MTGSSAREKNMEGKENNHEVFKNKRKIAKTEDKGEVDGPDEPGVCHLSSSGRLARPDQSLRSMYSINNNQSTKPSLFSPRRNLQSSVHCCVYSWVHNTNRTCRKRTAPKKAWSQEQDTRHTPLPLVSTDLVDHGPGQSWYRSGVHFSLCVALSARLFLLVVLDWVTE